MEIIISELSARSIKADGSPMYTIEERSHYRRIGACNASHRSRTMHLEAYFDTGSMQSASH